MRLIVSARSAVGESVFFAVVETADVDERAVGHDVPDDSAHDRAFLERLEQRFLVLFGLCVEQRPA